MVLFPCGRGDRKILCRDGPNPILGQQEATQSLTMSSGCSSLTEAPALGYTVTTPLALAALT